MVRTGLIALMFVVGITVGFVITAWLSGEAGDPVRTSFSGVRAYQRGISEGELPYDGRTVDAAARRAPEAETGINMQELPYGGVTSSGASMDKSEVTEHESLPLQSSPEPTSEVVPEVARKAETPPQAPVPAGKQGKRNVSHSEAKASPAPQHRRKTQRRNEKDREIQRIRQQAEDELKKKTDRRLDESRSASRGAGQKEGRTETASRSTRVAAMSAMLQQCELAGNLFRREYCKWQLCSGKWGKNGCPSYPSRSNPY